MQQKRCRSYRPRVKVIGSGSSAQERCPGKQCKTKKCSIHCPASVCYGKYVTLAEDYRREQVHQGHNCDIGIINGTQWYRFDLGTGENGVIDHCPEYDTCGTWAPIWLNGTHPTEYGMIKDVKMAGSTRGNSRGSHCFHESGTASVTKCNVRGDVFYLYKLWVPTTCSYSYCTRTYNLTWIKIIKLGSKNLLLKI